MSQQIWVQEWLDANSQRAYPLADDASQVDVTGAFALPRSFLVELSFPVHWGLAVEPSKFLIRSVAAFPTGYVIYLGYDDGSADPPVVATAQVARPAAENSAYNLVGQGDFDDCVGKLVIGRTDDVDALPAGRYVFDSAGARLDADCIRPIVRGISGLAVVTGGVSSARIYGDVELVPGFNTRLTLSRDGASATIRVDAIEGEGLSATLACAGGAGNAALSPPIRTINAIAPGPDGDFTLEAGPCVKVSAIAHGLALADTCSQPCCGCAELDAVKAELDHLTEQSRALATFVADLSRQVDQMGSTVLASRLNDVGGCP